MENKFEKVMNYYPPNKIVFDEIKNNLNNIVPFVGAGLSSFAYMMWKDILLNLCINLPKEKKVDIEQLVENQQYEEAANNIYQIYGKNIFYTALREMFKEDKINIQRLKQEAIALLPILFSEKCITTNFDRAIENAYAIQRIPYDVSYPYDTKKLNSSLQGQMQNLLFKIHGDIYSNEENIVFTGKSYEKHYKMDSILVTQLKKWMASKQLLFLGCSLGVDRTMDILKLVREEGGAYYTIISCDYNDIEKRKIELDDKGIMPIFYPKGEHECVRIILEKLLEISKPESYNNLDIHINTLPEKYNRFQYQAKKTDLIGREKELQRLKNFLNSSEPLLWWAITGSGGCGKSRLAYEFSKQMPSGWKSHFVNQNDYGQLESKYIRVYENTLFILDYVHAYINQIGSWILSIINSVKTCHIRILLIERDDVIDGKASWMDRLIDVMGSTSLKKIQYSESMLNLQTTIDKETSIQIIRNYAEKNKHKLSDDEVENLYRILIRVDSEYTRPLYAMMITDAKINGNDPIHWDEEKCLRFFNEREIEKIDNQIKTVFRIEKQGNRYFYFAIYDLILMSTCMEGLIVPDEAKRICQKYWNNFCSRTDRKEEYDICELLYNAQITTPYLDEMKGYVIRPILPDIMGEFFVLEQLSSNSFRRTKHSEWLIDIIQQIWETPNKAIAFFDRLFLDHKAVIEKQKDILKIILFPCINEDYSSLKLIQHNEYWIFLANMVKYLEMNEKLFVIDVMYKIILYVSKSKYKYIAKALALLSIEQELECRQKTIDKLDSIYNENKTEEITILYVSALALLSIEQVLEGKHKTIDKLESIYNENKIEIIALSYSKVLSILIIEQDLGGIQKTIDKLELIYRENKTEEIALIYANCLVNLSAKQDLEGIEKTEDKLGTIYKEYKTEEIAISYANTLAYLSTKQDLVGREKTVDKLETIYKEYKTEEIAIPYANALAMLSLKQNLEYLQKQITIYEENKTVEISLTDAETLVKISSEQDLKEIQKTIYKIDTIYKENKTEEIAISYANALSYLSAEQDLEGRQKTIDRLELIYKENETEEIAISYAKALSYLSAEQDLEGRQKTIDRLELIYKENETEEIALAYSKALVNLSAEQDLEGIQKSIDRLESIYKENKSEETAVSYAKALAYLSAEQGLESRQKTIVKIETIYDEYKTDDLKIILSNELLSIGFDYYSTSDFISAGNSFYKSYCLGDCDAANNLAYLLRRKEFSGFIGVDILDLLDKDKDDTFSIINRALYYINNVGDWEKASLYFLKLKDCSEKLDGVINWWTECYCNINKDQKGDLDRKEGCLVLLILMYHKFIPFDMECAKKMYSYYPNAPKWLKEVKH